jgi:hypothetical protein
MVDPWYDVRPPVASGAPALSIVSLESMDEAPLKNFLIRVKSGGVPYSRFFMINSSVSDNPPIGATITEFEGEPYRTAEPIPVTFQRLDSREIEARFEEAGIAWVGTSRTVALNGLKIELLNTLEGYEENEDVLGPWPRKQLDILRSLIRRESR